MIKKIAKLLVFFAVGITGGIFGVQIWLYFFPPQQSVYITERQEIVIRENQALENAVEKAEKTATGVRTQTAAGKILEGSGLIITSDGLVVTLSELVPQGSEFSFYIQGERVSYQILKRDLKANLALVKVGASNLPTASFGDSDKLRLGGRIFLSGFIFEEGVPKIVANEGILRSFGETYIQTTIFENAAMRGSALFDIEGNVLGISEIDREGRVIFLPITAIKEFSGL